MKLGDHTIVLVTRQSTGQTGLYGQDVLADAYTEVLWCLVVPGSSSEPADQSAARIAGLQLYAPPGTQLDAVDAVIYPPTATGDPDQPWTGPMYEVDGDVGMWDDVVQANLTRRT